MLPRVAPLLLAAAVATLSPAAHGQRAEYAAPEELPEDDAWSHLAEVTMLGEYSRVAESDRVGDLEHVGVFAFRGRFYLGPVLAFCLGPDGAIGGSDAGVAYRMTFNLVGLGVRFGKAGVVSLCSGARIDAIGSDVPWALSVPAELSATVSLGPIRPSVWFRPLWMLNEDERRDGIESDLADEVETGISVRIGEQHRYWSRMSAGGGPVLGVGYRGFMDTHALSVTLGMSFAGEE
jgi:hypothetical protein